MWLNIQIYKRLCEEGQMPAIRKENKTDLTSIKELNDRALDQTDEDNNRNQRIGCRNDFADGRTGQ